MNEVNPKETTRAYAFEMWINAPMPMLTFFKTIDVTRLARISKRTGLKFNMLMCWCIGRAASGIKEFHMLPVGRKLIQYDSIAVNTIVANREGEVESCRNHDLTDSMVIGTSALAQYEIDGAVGMYSGVFNNPFMIWGKYKRHLWKRTLTVSFQFHHTQMDGAHAARFLENLQKEIRELYKTMAHPSRTVVPGEMGNTPGGIPDKH